MSKRAISKPAITKPAITKPVGKPIGSPATIRDVSRLAGVSRMTVSRVLTKPDLVAPETRAEVQRAIASLGYVPDRSAGALARRRSGFVALVVPTLTNANFAMVAHGLTDALRGSGFQLLITYDNYSLGEEEVQLRNLLSRRPEAVVVCGAVHSREAIGLLTRADVPVIEVAETTVHPIDHSVGFSNYAVGRMAARHFIARGFTRIGALASLPEVDVADHRGEARIRGFEDELALAGLSGDYVLRTGRAPVSFAHGEHALDELVDRHPQVEAVFCVSDLAAVGALMACQRRGIVVPDQLSLLGFGDFEIGRVVNPSLSTFRVDFQEIGRKAGALVVDLLGRAPANGPVRLEQDVTLVERGTVRS